MFTGRMLIVISTSLFIASVGHTSQQDSEDYVTPSYLENYLKQIEHTEETKRSTLALGILMALPEKSKGEFFRSLPRAVAIETSLDEILRKVDKMDLTPAQKKFIREAQDLGEKMIAGDIDDVEASLMLEQFELRSIELFGEELAKKLFSGPGSSETKISTDEVSLPGAAR